MNLTRRSTLQGVGAAGLAGIAGNAFVSVGSAQEAQQQDGAALRVAHASPDTPAVEVHVDEAGAGGGTPDAGGTPGDDGEETPEGGDDEPLVEGLEFRGVSDYEEVEPGTYRVRIVATGESGLLDEIFGGDDEEQVVFEDEIEVEEGTTYTAVAYGELARSEMAGAGGGVETPTPGGDTTGGETGGTTPGAGGTAGDGEVLVEGLAFGEAEYFEVDAGDHTLEFRESGAAGGDGLGGATTPGDDGTTPGADGTPTAGTAGTGGDDQGFQVAVLEDELSVTGAGTAGDATGTPDDDGGTPTDDGGLVGDDEEGTPGGDGEETSRIRVFHAVPDVDALDVVSVEGDGDGGLLGDGDEEETPEEGTPDGEATPDGGGGGEENAQQAEISPEGGVVYSGFAVGYFDPEAASGGEGEETPAALGDDEETPGGETPTDGEGDDGIAEDPEGEEFEFVTVEDARDGERSDGGTGGGLLPSQAAASASSD